MTVPTTTLLARFWYARLADPATAPDAIADEATPKVMMTLRKNIRMRALKT
jgi:hypothetical protein